MLHTPWGWMAVDVVQIESVTPKPGKDGVTEVVMSTEWPGEPKEFDVVEPYDVVRQKLGTLG